MAPVKVGMVACKSADNSKSTFQQLFGKDISDLSCEEFFVWCLGLPHYEMGAGKNAITIHMDVVRKFNLDKVEIERAIAAVRKKGRPRLLSWLENGNSSFLLFVHAAQYRGSLVGAIRLCIVICPHSHSEFAAASRAGNDRISSLDAKAVVAAPL